VIRGHHLPPTLQMVEPGQPARGGTLPQLLADFERDLIVDALKDSRGNMAKAARELGITERVMGLRVRKYGIEFGRFRT